MEAGLAGPQLLAVVRSIETDNPAAPEREVSKGALRMRRLRERRAEADNVTRDVTCDATCDVTDVTPDPSPDKSPPHPHTLTPTPGVCVAPTREADPIDAIVAAWNAMAKRSGLRAVQKLTAERRGRLRARLAEHGVDGFTEAIAAVERSPFCLGDSERGWRADFDFLLQPKSFTRLIEGSYDRTPSSNSTTRRGRGSQHPGGRHCAAADQVFPLLEG